MRWSRAASASATSAASKRSGMCCGQFASHAEIRMTMARSDRTDRFVLIILEILKTVTAHLKAHSFALRPFIIIGIISAVRHLLIIGARMSVGEGNSPSDAVLFMQHVQELALNGFLALVLVSAYWLIARLPVDKAD